MRYTPNGRAVVTDRKETMQLDNMYPCKLESVVKISQPILFLFPELGPIFDMSDHTDFSRDKNVIFLSHIYHLKPLGGLN